MRQYTVRQFRKIKEMRRKDRAISEEESIALVQRSNIHLHTEWPYTEYT